MTDNKPHTGHVAGIAIFVIMACLPTILSAQFVQLRLDIKPKTTVNAKQMLNFGSLPVNSGTTTINLGDPNMGIFNMRAIKYQTLLISYKKPFQLNHRNTEIEEHLPLQLDIDLGYSNDRFNDTSTLSETLQMITVKENNDKSFWNMLYMFLYGSVTVGDVPTGRYTNDVLINIHYM